MAPKRGHTKAKAAVAVSADAEVDSTPVELPTKKKTAKTVQIAEDNEDASGNSDVKIAPKRGRRAATNGNGDVPVEPEKNGGDQAKLPAKRGRKAKEAPPAKKAKSDSEEEADAGEQAPEVEEKTDDVVEKPAAKRGRKQTEKKETAKPKTKAKKSSEDETIEPEVETEEPEVEAKVSEAESEAGEAEAEALKDQAETPEEEAKMAPEAPAKRGRGAKKAPKEADEPAEKAPPRKRGGAAKANEEVPAKKPLQNKSATDYASINFECTTKNASGKTHNYKISSWNVDGLRAWMNKGGLEFIHFEKPDILCLQETKCSEDKLPADATAIEGYHPYWLNGEKEGYAGVGVYSKEKALSVKYGLEDEELDSEGRIITVELDKFYVICTYVPNSGRGLVTLPKRLQWNGVFQKYVKELDSKKPVVICGDMNVSHLEIDLANPKTNKKNAGFTQEERDGMTNLLGDGFVDTFRHLYPDKTAAYTFWTYMSNCRAKNIGWRLDYAIVSERLVPGVCDNVIRNEVFGSDHCPITLFLHLDELEESSTKN